MVSAHEGVRQRTQKAHQGNVSRDAAARRPGGRQPFNEATWIFVGAVLTSVIDACATHMSARHDGCLPAYFGSLYHGVVNDLARILGALVLLNVNVVLLFIFGILAAHRSGSTWRGTIFFALMNAGLGYLIVAIELELD